MYFTFTFTCSFAFTFTFSHFYTLQKSFICRVNVESERGEEGHTDVCQGKTSGFNKKRGESNHTQNKSFFGKRSCILIVCECVCVCVCVQNLVKPRFEWRLTHSYPSCFSFLFKVFSFQQAVTSKPVTKIVYFLKTEFKFNQNIKPDYQYFYK